MPSNLSAEQMEELRVKWVHLAKVKHPLTISFSIEHNGGRRGGWTEEQVQMCMDYFRPTKKRFKELSEEVAKAKQEADKK
ncbi:hypothetical protein LTR64_008667 [Lithohypha guttulata]|uniref:uncharacterized protein n=1 Tax=Lithohypha guttulata TaxID=1690604 RepID=UPI00315DDF2B